MFSQKKTVPLTRGYWSDINDVARRIRNTERIILGVGSGLSAAGGLDYSCRAVALRWFPEYAVAGCRSIA